MTYKIKIVQKNVPSAVPPFDGETDLPVPRVGDHVGISGGEGHEVLSVTYQFFPAGGLVEIAV